MKRAALLYAVITFALAYPLTVHPASAVLSDAPDTNLMMWTLAWDAHAFVHQPLGIFDANIFYPARHSLAFSENLIGSGMMAAPVIWTTGNLVLAMNLVSLASAILCGMGAYLLGRRLGMGEAGALVAGLVFAFSPPRFLRLDQIHLATIQWVPFALAFLQAYLDEGRSAQLRWYVFFATLQALTSGHGMVFLGVASIVVAACAVAFGTPLAPVRRLRDLGAPGVLLLAPAALLLIPYREAQVGVGLRRSLENWTVTPESFLASPSHVQTWLLGLFHATGVNERASAYLFPGFSVLVLALAGIAAVWSSERPWRRWPPSSRTRAVVTYAALAILSILLTLDRPFGLWPFVYWLPVMNFIRVPSRFVMLALLGLAVLAGFGAEALTARLRRRTAAALAIGALLVGEFAAMPFELAPRRVEIPAIDRWLAGQSDVTAIVELPEANPANLSRAERWHTAYMLHSTAHWKKTVDGYSGIRPAFHEQLYAALAAFPDERAVPMLAAAGVTHVVVHLDMYDDRDRAAIAAALDRAAWLRLVHAEGDGRVYALIGARGPK
ncbi:MAG TPA: hypothetical protein VL309_08025 [Vicinamibacterales bacterium]|nr:hypothetical protein [Vicinamibacterales bacterium]